MTSRDIRRSYFDFFTSRQHTLVQSAPVIPGDDPTLLFTNSGMNQFKDVFLGTGSRPYSRAVDTQKCIRVSGKHNDLEEVGRDTYHHTFFEMLGNWSFGDYYKKEAISWAWELLTKEWGLPKERLWATVYQDDGEAERLWKEVTDIDPGHVLRFGEKDNFWEMGETGPCGPCSEIHFDRTADGTATAALVNAGTPEVIEIWNLVFIQYDRDGTGALHPLPAKHVDTGMGFERICAVLQNKPSNYDTDVFLPLIRRVAEISSTPYDGRMDAEGTGAQLDADVAMRVIADHIRTLTFAIADGVVPSNEGRGYVLRRILRRAARFGRSLNMREPFLHKLVGTLAETMGDVFPEIVTKQEDVSRVIKGEEESFNATLDRGLEEFESIVKRKEKSAKHVISGEEAFTLHDTFGFPFDLTALIAQERGFTVDERGFQDALEAQKERSREARSDGKQTPGVTFSSKEAATTSSRFLGYTQEDATSTVLTADEHFIVLEETPFYAESGGQIGDTGTLKGDGFELRVLDTQKDGAVIGHRYEGPRAVSAGVKVRATINAERRQAIARNHTATHIVHEALRRVLGEHLHQQGSLVADTHLRFDFNHFEKVGRDRLTAIEQMVNAKITEGITVHALNDSREWVTIDEARRRWPNVKMFFGEKYGDRVRVVEIDPSFSVELCGGTHVASTSDIGYFKFRTEGSVASGIRRIEAVTGEGARQLAMLRQADLRGKVDAAFRSVDGLVAGLGNGETSFTPEAAQRAQTLGALVKRLDELDGELRTGRSGMSVLGPAYEKIDALHTEAESLFLEITALRKRVERSFEKERLQDSASRVDEILAGGTKVDSFTVVAAPSNARSLDELKAAGDTLRTKLGSGVGLLSAIIDDKVQLVCVVTEDLIAGKRLTAGAIVGKVAKIVGGGGGGKPHLATAGGKDVTRLTEALAKTPDIVRSFLTERMP